jgi:YlmC/YmxH family sporulation protein
MLCKFMDLRRKEVVGIKDGTKYGSVSDFVIDTETSKITSFIVYGKPKFLGLFGREDDFVIKWDDINMIGGDIILVNCGRNVERKKRKGFFSDFFTEV